MGACVACFVPRSTDRTGTNSGVFSRIMSAQASGLDVEGPTCSSGARKHTCTRWTNHEIGPRRGRRHLRRDGLTVAAASRLRGHALRPGTDPAPSGRVDRHLEDRPRRLRRRRNVHGADGARRRGLARLARGPLPARDRHPLRNHLATRRWRVRARQLPAADAPRTSPRTPRRPADRRALPGLEPCALRGRLPESDGRLRRERQGRHAAGARPRMRVSSWPRKRRWRRSSRTVRRSPAYARAKAGNTGQTWWS